MILKSIALCSALLFGTGTNSVNIENPVILRLNEETPNVEETPTTPETEPVWENKVYTFNDNGEYIYTITLTSEKDFTLSEETTGLVINGGYELKENKLTLKYQDHIVFVFNVNADGTLSVAPIVTPEQVTSEVEKFLSRFFSPEVIGMIVTWTTLLGIGIYALIKAGKNKKIAVHTADEVATKVLNVTKDYVSESVHKEMEKYLPQLLGTIGKTNDILSLVTKVMALTQENTPTSRLAVLQALEELGVIDKETTDTSKKVIEEQEKEKETKKEETDKQLDAIINDTNDGTSI